MAEETRRLAELLKSGRESFETGDRDAARESFLQALGLVPEEPTARLYLDRIQQGESAALAPMPASEPAAAQAAAPPRATVQETRPAPAAVAAPPSRGRLSLLDPKVLGVVGAFLVMTVVGVYFVMKSGGRAAVPVSKAAAPGSIEHARELLGEGRVAESRRELQRIGGDSAEYAEARKMLADLGKGGAGGASPAKPAGALEARPQGKTSEGDPARLRAAAETALQERRYIEAFKNFNLAAAAFRDDPTFTKGMGVAADKVTALTPAVKLYNEGEYDTAIPILWRIYQEDHENQDARSYLFRSYFNQGVTQLQNGLYLKAAKNFQEAVGLEPNDIEAARHRRFAEHYQKGDLDLMGRIYVRHLNHRP